MKYRFISVERANYAVKLLCRVLNVSRSGFYSFLSRKLSKREEENHDLLVKIKSSFLSSRKTYGSKRIHAELNANGISIGKNRIARLMQINKIFATKIRRRRLTRAENTNKVFAPNILQRRFSQHAPNKAWVSDITYLPTHEGFLYLAGVMDLFSRRIIGFTMSSTQNTNLILGALKVALNHRQNLSGLILHSDQGSQYKSHEYQQELEKNKILCSMSRHGNCHDNAVKESFFSSLKRELMKNKSWTKKTLLRSAVTDYIVSFYNLTRRHSSIGYISPIEFENNYYKKLAAS